MMFTCTLPLPQSLSHFIISAFNLMVKDFEPSTTEICTLANRVNNSICFSFSSKEVHFFPPFYGALRIMCHFCDKTAIGFEPANISECFDALDFRILMRKTLYSLLFHRLFWFSRYTFMLLSPASALFSFFFELPRKKELKIFFFCFCSGECERSGSESGKKLCRFVLPSASHILNGCCLVLLQNAVQVSIVFFFLIAFALSSAVDFYFYAYLCLVSRSYACMCPVRWKRSGGCVYVCAAFCPSIFQRLSLQNLW